MSTQQYRRILVGIDGSEQADLAFKRAVEVARRNNGKVFVAMVLDQQFYNFMGYTPLNQNIIDQETESAKDLLGECEAYGRSVGFQEIERIIAYGSAKDALAHQLPEKYDIDLIMVGQSGLNAVERVVIGSVSSYITREAPCDVLVVRAAEKDA